MFFKINYVLKEVVFWGNNGGMRYQGGTNLKYSKKPAHLSMQQITIDEGGWGNKIQDK